MWTPSTACKFIACCVCCAAGVYALTTLGLRVFVVKSGLYLINPGDSLSVIAANEWRKHNVAVRCTFFFCSMAGYALARYSTLTWRLILIAGSLNVVECAMVHCAMVKLFDLGKADTVTKLSFPIVTFVAAGVLGPLVSGLPGSYATTRILGTPYGTNLLTWCLSHAGGNYTLIYSWHVFRSLTTMERMKIQP